MWGYVIWRPAERSGVSVYGASVGSAPVCMLEVRGSGWRTARRVRRELARLTDRGVRRWVLPPDWPAAWGEAACPISEQGLRRALFPKLLNSVCDRNELTAASSAVLLTAPRTDRWVWEAAEYLCCRCRYLHLEAAGSEELRRRLWLRYGLAAGGSVRPALQVCFDSPTTRLPAVLLGPECERRQPAVYRVPPARLAGFGPHPVTPQLTAALWECGAVPAEEIQVVSLGSNA